MKTNNEPTTETNAVNDNLTLEIYSLITNILELHISENNDLLELLAMVAHASLNQDKKLWKKLVKMAKKTHQKLEQIDKLTDEVGYK